MSSGLLEERLADALWPDAGHEGGEYHTRAPVQSVAGGKVNVLLRGSDSATPCAKLASCSPKAGDVALVLVTPGGCVVLGTVG